jgi:hypothetical protein
VGTVIWTLHDHYGSQVPAYWMVEDEVGSMGSVAHAAAWQQSRICEGASPDPASPPTAC